MAKPLKNPPVYFTGVEARFNALLKLGDYLPSIQESMRKAGFSDFATRKTVAIQIAAQEGQQTPAPTTTMVEQFVFGNLEKTHRFILGSASLVLVSTRYGHFEDFSDKFLRALTLVHEVVKLDFTERVGLRYLDHISPMRGDSLNQYLVPEVFGLRARLGGEPVYVLTETVNRIGNVQVRSRAVVQNGPLAFPPDLQPEGMAVDNRFLERSGLHAILDTDGSVEGRLIFSIDVVSEQLHAIHGVLSDTFAAVATDYARKVWNE
jgi:uncharacterized protein (TIGR04255 family)